MRITAKLVREVLRKNKESLHPQAWHDFMSLREVKAINWVIFKNNNELPLLSVAYIRDQAIEDENQGWSITDSHKGSWNGKSVVFCRVRKVSSGWLQGTSVPVPARIPKYKRIDYMLDNNLI